MKWLAIIGVIIWLIDGVVVLRPKYKPAKLDYSICWATLMMILIINCLKYFL